MNNLDIETKNENQKQVIALDWKPNTENFFKKVQNVS